MADFRVLTKDNCGHCVRAKMAIERAGFTYEEEHYGMEDMEKLIAMGFRSFPQVYHGEKHIGGADQTIAYLDSLKDDF